MASMPGVGLGVNAAGRGRADGGDDEWCLKEVSASAECDTVGGVISQV